MKIETKNVYQITATLSQEDLDNLINGKIVIERYLEGKLFINMINPLKNGDNRIEKLKEREYAVIDRESDDVDIFIPHAVLMDCRISASNFNQGFGNLEIKPWMLGEPYASANIKVKYPNSLQIIDLGRIFGVGVSE